MDVRALMTLWMVLLSCGVFTISGAVSPPPVTYGYEDPSKNLVNNWDFEDDFDPNNGDWYPTAASYQFENDAHTGSRSVRVFNMTKTKFCGVTQKFGVGRMKPRTTYYVSMFIKITKNPTTGMFGTVRLQTSSKRSDGSQITNHNVGRLRVLRAASHWRQLGGDYVTPDEIHYGTFIFLVSSTDFEYLIDSVSVIELPYNEKWQKQADIDIEKYRKNMLTLNMYVPKRLEAFCKVKVELTQKKRHFGIGSAIKADLFNGNDEFGVNYRKFFFKNFEWAVFENDMKWKPMEKWQGYPKFGRVDKSLEYLEEYNVTLRGHSVLWGIKEANPTWVQSLTGTDLLDAVNTRIDYLIEHFKGSVVEWDVINEYMHSRFYTDELNDPLFIDKVHKRIHALDPDVGLVVNDYEVMRSGELTSSIVDLANTLMKRDVPVHGIGIQSHMRYLPVSPQAVKKRLEIATSLGLPVTLTELSIHTPNETERAWMLDVMLRMSFSNPGVQAVVFWQFSDTKQIGFEPDDNQTAFFIGPEFKPNEAGRLLQKLLKKWRTSRTFYPKSRYLQERISAFHGLYEVKVYYKDQFIKNASFYLHPGQDLRFTIPLTAAEVKDVDDDDPDNCGVWVAETDGDDDKTKPRKTGRAYDRLSKLKKKTKVKVRPYVKGKNIAN